MRYFLILMTLLVLSLPLFGQTVLEAEYPGYINDTVAVIDVPSQQLTLYKDGKAIRHYPVSTAERGVGNRANSNQTPPGVHYIRKKMGAGEKSGTVFKARVSTRKRVAVEHRPRHLDGDFVTSRILWLGGLEPGVNLGKGIDSFKRYIYIHGTPEEGLIGRPASHGCIRMRNADVIELFDLMPEKSLVKINP
ncbi:MAG TPA: L,D-transpeptidase [Gammaproteobacteria bacterium]|nr:L,D-transpeptidase [Gammaproteobacteria bacterium]